MRYKLLGGSGLRVSEIGLGTMTFGETKGWGADAAQSAAIMSAYADAGGVLLDTAPNYAGGESEKIVGAFTRGRRRDFVISTKYTGSGTAHVLAGGNSRLSMTRSVEDSLRRLETDHVDLFWLHFWDGTTPLYEILRALDDLVSAGKILYVGFSDTPAWLVSRAVTMAEGRGWIRPAAIQIEYNLASRDAERELLPMADALDLGAMCWGPLAAGAFAGGADPKRRAKLPPHLAEIAVKLDALAEQTGLSASALALRWLLRHPARRTLVPLIGARTAEQLTQTLAAAEGDLDAETIAALDALAPPALGFPHEMIASPYLRKLALGQPDALDAPQKPRG
ncbi:MAG: aldo/keto reductase [Pseudomonadota bacterium]